MASPSGLYTDTMDVYSVTTTVKDSGGFVRTTAVKASAQPCRVQTDNATGSVINMGDGMGVVTRVFTDYANCVNGDELHIDSRVIRVTGTPIKRRAIGNMDAFYVVTGLEIIN